MAGTNFVQHQLSQLLHAMPEGHKVFGPLDEGKLQLPRSQSADGRKLTWPKLLRRIARSVTNTPTSRLDCWYIPSVKEDGYHESKLSATGSKAKYRTHRLLRLFVEPSSYDLVHLRDLEVHAIHRCGRGKASAKGKPCCINPHHIYFGSCTTNQDTKGCKYGAAFLCPHEPKCIWVHPDSGIIKPCRSDTSVTSCTCGQNCFDLSL